MKVTLSMSNRRPIAARDCEEPLPTAIWRWRPDASPSAMETPQDKNAAGPKTEVPSDGADQQMRHQSNF